MLKELEVEKNGETQIIITYRIYKESIQIFNYKVYDYFLKNDWVTVHELSEENYEKLQNYVRESLNIFNKEKEWKDEFNS